MQRLVLEMPAGFQFRAGQYLEVLHADGPVPLSVASGPRRLPELHLHYRSTPGTREAVWMDELLAIDAPLRVRGPLGDVLLPPDHDLPLLLIAGGTGAAQVCAMLDELETVQRRAPVTVLCCADSTAELYCRPELESLRTDWLQVECVVDPRRDEGNAGLQRLRELALQISSSGTAFWVLLAGSPGFVYAAFDTMTRAGVDPADIHSDVFAYAPRAAPPPRD